MSNFVILVFFSNSVKGWIVEQMNTINLLILSCFSSTFIVIEIDVWFFDLLCCVWIYRCNETRADLEGAWICQIVAVLWSAQFVVSVIWFCFYLYWFFDEGIFWVSVIYKFYTSYFKVVLHFFLQTSVCDCCFLV